MSTTKAHTRERRYTDALGIEYVLRTDDPELDIETAFLWHPISPGEEYLGTHDGVCAYQFKIIGGWLDYEDAERVFVYVTGEAIERAYVDWESGSYKPFQIEAELRLAK